MKRSAGEVIRFLEERLLFLTLPLDTPLDPSFFSAVVVVVVVAGEL